MEILNPENKIEFINSFLSSYDSIFFHTDARVDGVIVPEQFKNQAQLVLQIGYNMPVRIHDIFMDELGISATLSFAHIPFHCFLPWDSIFAISVDGTSWSQFVLWKNEAVAIKPIKKENTKSVPHLRLV